MKARTLATIALSGMVGLVVLGACSSSEDEAPDRELTVFAAASLTETFTELADDFEADHPGVTVRLNFAGSSDLATQIVEGAPADVFAAADERTMGTVIDAIDGVEPRDFATNTLQVVTPADDPGGVDSLADLADPGVAVVLCAPQVPCGAAAARLLEDEALTVKPVSEEQSVTDVLGKVRSGEADAGLVYVTDVRAAGDDVRGVDTPEAASVVNVYPIAALPDASDGDLAREFVALVTGSAGRDVLTQAGFGAP